MIDNDISTVAGARDRYHDARGRRRSTISVAMCTYNGERYVKEQIESIIRQTRPPDELVICDDRSVDETVAIAQLCAQKAPFPVRVIVNPERLGTVANFDQVIGLCTGELIALSDQDDVWNVDKLAVAEREFASDPDLGGLFSDAELVDEQLGPMGGRMWAMRNFGEREQALLNHRPAEILLPQSVVTGATLTFKRRFHALISPIPEGIPGYIHDRWMAVLVAAVAKLRGVPEPLIQYRQHPEQQIGAQVSRPPGLSKRVRTHRDAYRSDLEGMLAVHARLIGTAGFDPHPAFMEVLEERIRHLQTRLHLPAKLVKRLPAVMREFGSGRYHRFASGIVSALKDLARPSELAG